MAVDSSSVHRGDVLVRAEVDGPCNTCDALLATDVELRIRDAAAECCRRELFGRWSPPPTANAGRCIHMQPAWQAYINPSLHLRSMSPLSPVPCIAGGHRHGPCRRPRHAAARGGHGPRWPRRASLGRRRPRARHDDAPPPGSSSPHDVAPPRWPAPRHAPPRRTPARHAPLDDAAARYAVFNEHVCYLPA